MECLGEIEVFRQEMNIPKNKTWLMPAGDTRETLIEMYPKSIEMAMKVGYNWTGRDHIIAYDTKRAV
jgi:7-carboxy-7-deazaguanine synthase